MLQFDPQTASTIGGICIAPLTSLQRIAIGLFVPAMSFVLLLLTVGFHFVLAHLQPFRCFKCCSSLRPLNRTSYIRTALTLFVSSYQQVTSNVLHILNCIHAGRYTVVQAFPGNRTIAIPPLMLLNVDVDCSDSRYLSWRVFAIFLLVTNVALVPIAMFAWLHKNRQLIEARDRAFASVWGVLFEGELAVGFVPSLILRLFSFQATCCILASGGARSAHDPRCNRNGHRQRFTRARLFVGQHLLSAHAHGRAAIR